MSEAPEEDEESEAPARRGLIAVFYRHRRLLGVAGGLWFAFLMVGGIFLSQLDARLGLNLFGPRVLVAHEPALLRVALRELRLDRLKPLEHAEVRLEGPGGVAGPWRLGDRAAELVQGQIVAPAAGEWTVVVTAEVPDAQLRLEVPIRVVEQAPVVVAAPEKRGPLPRPDRGSLRLEVLPTDYFIPANLPGRLTIRATDEQGRPAVGQAVKLVLREGRTSLGLPAEVVTGPHGLVEVPVQSLHTTFWIEAEAGTAPAAPVSLAPPSAPAPAPASVEAPASAEAPASLAPFGSVSRRLRHRAPQFVMVTGEPIVTPGAQVAVGIKSLHKAGPVFVDIWQGERWRTSRAVELAEGEARFFLDVPEFPAHEDPALLWIQAYRSAYLPGASRGGTYVLATRQAPEAALRALAARLVAAGHDAPFLRHQAEHAQADPVLARHLLGLLPRPDADPPLLADTSESARQTVGSLKGTWQRRFVWGLVGSGVLLFGILLALMRQNAREVQQRWIEAGGDEEAGRGTRMLLREGLYLFLILAVFLGALVQLVLVIRW